MKKFHNMIYHIWDFEGIDPLLHTQFDKDLRSKFDDLSHEPPEAVEDVRSIGNKVLHSVTGFSEIRDKLLSSLNEQLEIINFYNKKDNTELSLARLWANRMRTNSCTKIHWHSTRFVMVYYHYAPENSGELVFVEPKNAGRKTKIETDFPESEKIKIKPKTQTCIFHDGNIPHAVGLHQNEEDRISIIFEFSLERNYKKIFEKRKKL